MHRVPARALPVAALVALVAVVVPARGAPGEAARAIAADAAGEVGLSAVCGGDPVETGARRRVPDGGALKVAVLLAALTEDARPAATQRADPVYGRVLAEGDLAAANGLMLRLGDGSPVRGRVAVNGFLRRAGLTDSSLDGPYRQGGGPSLKRTSARDLRLMVEGVDRAARGAGPLASLGVSREEARLVRDLMARTTEQGLLAGHVPGRLVHRVGRLADQRNDAAVLVRPGGVRCHVGLAVTGTDGDAARAVGAAMMTDVVVPLSREARPAPAAGTTTPAREDPPPGRTDTVATAAPAAVGDDDDTGATVALWLAVAAVIGLVAAGAGRAAQARRGRDGRPRRGRATPRR